MIWHVAVLLLCQLAGEVIVKGLNLSLPGPVLGMVLLVIILILRPIFAQSLKPTASGLLTHLSLLFVPAGVGIVGHVERLGTDGFGLSDHRDELRDHFEIDANHIVWGALSSLHQQKKVDQQVLDAAKQKLRINNNKKSPTRLNYGLSYRVGDAAILTVGFQYKDWNFAINYDMTLSSAANYNSNNGGPEIGIFKIFTFKKKPKKITTPNKRYKLPAKAICPRL